MQPLVRPSRDDDIPAITAIYAHAVRYGRASFELDPPDAAEMTRRRAGVLAEGWPYLVAEIDGQVAGYTYAHAYRPRRAYRFSLEDSIYVAPDRLHSGVGRAMLAELITRCEAGGARLMIAVIGDSANAGSIGLHTALGFTHAGVLPASGWKHEQWLDTVLMVRQLGPGASAPPPPGR